MPRWVLPIIAGVVGIAGGLVYGWVISPVKFIDTTPASLRADFRADYVLMVAEAYTGDQDAALAGRRLALFGTESPAEIVQQAIEAGIQAGYPEADVAQLQELRRAMQAYQPPLTPPAGEAP